MPFPVHPQARPTDRKASRSGDPNWTAVSASPTPPSWSHRVTWERADLLRPSTYASLIHGADYVVHSMGILLEADYKRVISGQESPLGFLKRMVTSETTAPSQQQQDIAGSARRAPLSPSTNPTADLVAPGEPPLTYEIMNRDSALALARLAACEGVGAMAYISAAAGAPVLPPRYMSTKREAEGMIARDFPKVRSVFLRPPLLYDQSRPVTLVMAGMVGVGAAFNAVTGGILKGFLGSAGMSAVKADTVARATVEALGDEMIRGPVEGALLEELGQRAWRREML